MLPSAVSDSRVHNILPNKIETDFQFSRASAATRVNHQGLIENVGYFSDELVQNGNFSELGPEIIINGDFTTDSDWSLGAGWTISNGKLRADNVSLINTFQVYFYTSGKTYKVTYTISDYVKGEVRFQLGGGGSTVNGATRDANGTYTEYIVATANHTSARFRALSADGGFTGSIDNVSVKQVDPDDDWILGGNAWSITDKLSADGTQTTGTNSYQNQTFDNGKTYKIVFTCTIQAGNLDVRLQGGGATVVGTNRTTSGTYTQLLTSTGNTSLRFRGDSNFIGSISSVSAVEVIGDKPRLDYDPLNPTCPHLLLEPQSTNLIPFSEDFSNGWVNQNTIDTANQTTSPDGANNGTQLTNTTSSSNYIYRQVTLSTSTDYSISVFVKKGTSNIARLDTWDTTGSTQGSIQLNLDTEVASIITGTASFEKYPNDWYKLKVSFTSSGSLGTTYYRIFNDDGVNGSYIYIFGAQLEQQSSVTSYIPTAGAAETRVAETCNSAGNVDTFNSEEGVLYAEIQGLSNTGTVRLSISDGTNNNNTYIELTTDLVVSVGRVGAVNQYALSSSQTITNFNKIAIKYKVNDIALWVNGTQAATDTSANTYPSGTLSQINFNRGDGGTAFYGKTKALATYNRALTDTELYTITSTQYSAYSGMVAALGNYTIPC